jgi:hypothetical protein
VHAHPLAGLDPGDSGADGRDHAGRFVAKRGGKVLEGPHFQEAHHSRGQPGGGDLNDNVEGARFRYRDLFQDEGGGSAMGSCSEHGRHQCPAHEYELASSSGEYGSAAREVSATWGSSRCDNRLM